MAEPQEGSLRGCLLPLAILAVMATVFYGVYRAQTQGSDDFQANAGPYLDALVAGDWARAATLDHPDRAVSAAELEAIWTAREGRLGDLTGWSLRTVNPGMDPDGAFVLGLTQLEFAGLGSPAPVRFELRPDPSGALQVMRASQVSKVLPGEPPVW